MRELLAWKEEWVGEYCELLNSVILQDEIEDKLSWLLEPAKGYTVSGLYQLLSYEEPSGRSATTNIIWDKAIPLKSLFSWQFTS